MPTYLFRDNPAAAGECVRVRAPLLGVGTPSEAVRTVFLFMRVVLRRQLKHALVLAGVARFFPAHACAEDGLEHVALESPNNRIALEQI